MRKNATIIQVFLVTLVSLALFIMVTLGYMLYSFSNDIWMNEDWQKFKLQSDAEFDLIDSFFVQTDQKKTSGVAVTANRIFTGKLEILDEGSMQRTEAGRELIRTNSQSYMSPDTSKPWTGAYRLSNDQGYLLITKSDSRDILVEHFKWTWLLFPFLILGSAILVGAYMLYTLIQRPIENIVKSADMLWSGNLDIRADTSAVAPIDRLAECFNGMADDLQRTFVEKEMMLAAIPHELRTPVASLSFMLEIGKTKKNKSEFVTVLREIEGTVNELQSAIDDVLDLTSFRDLESVETTLFSPYELCRKEIALLDEDARHKVELDVDQSLRLYGNCNLLTRALQNVLSNSVRYADSKCLVTIAVEDENAILSVEDDGFGVPEEHQAAVFEAFTKLDLSRSKNGVGLGLGLPLVRVIMNKHGGTATMRVSQLGGACVEMQWPALS
jgi:signal transduction histidine kinase